MLDSLKIFIIRRFETAFLSTFTRGEKIFELSNHLGNVLETVNDKKIAFDDDADDVIDYYEADVVSANDYYPGGMTMPGRKYQQGISSYRYGFNGQEKSLEIIEESYTATYWEYDSRTGRRWNVDPILKTWESPYATFGSNPVLNIDPDGADWYKDTKGKNKGDVVFMEGSRKHKGYRNITGTWTKRNSNGFSYLYGHGKADVLQSSSKDLLQGVTVTATVKRSLADKSGLSVFNNTGPSKVWREDYWNYKQDGNSAGLDGERIAMYNRWIQADKDYRNMQLAAAGIMAAPLTVAVAPEAFIGSLSFRMISVGGDALVQYVSNIPQYGFGRKNVYQMNLASLGGSLIAPGNSLISSVIGNGFVANIEDGYQGISGGSNGANIFSNILIGYGGNKIGNHYKSLLKNPTSKSSQLRSNLIGNLHGNLIQKIKDGYIRLNQ